MTSNKPPLLFIHGFRGDDSGLKDLADHFSDYTVFVPSIPPAEGQSLLQYNTNRYVEWVIGFITKHKLQNPVLIGHSMGSIIAAAVASQRPELVNQKVVLLAPISYKPNKFFEILTPLSAVLPNKIVDFISTKYLFVPKNPALFKNVMEKTNQCSAGYKSKLDIFKTARFSATHGISDFDLDKEVLFVAGTKDRLMPQKKTEALANAMGAKAVFLENSGHLLNYEQPAEVANVIRQFLASDK